MIGMLRTRECINSQTIEKAVDPTSSTPACIVHQAQRQCVSMSVTKGFIVPWNSLNRTKVVDGQHTLYLQIMQIQFHCCYQRAFQQEVNVIMNRYD